MALCTCCGGCGCAQCQPSNRIFDCDCADPGILTPGRHLLVLDHQFCERRLENGPGYLVATEVGGGFMIEWTTEPKVDLSSIQAVVQTEFGQLVVIGSDNVSRRLLPPAIAGKILIVNGAGELVFDDPPVVTVPDPLTVTTLNATNGNIVDLHTTGLVTLDNILAGTIVGFLGLNAANEVVTTGSVGVQGAMFFESPTSPNAGTPNSAVGAGNYLTIGNLLYDSGGSLIAVTNATTLTVSQPGKYALIWQASFNKTGAGERPGAWLEVNGIIVNYGGGRALGVPNNNNAYLSQTGFEFRTLAAGDVIRLQNNPTSSAAVYEVRLAAIKLRE